MKSNIYDQFLFRDKLQSLYYLANLNYPGTYMRIARDTILKVCGYYNATNYWTDRAAIGDAMKSALVVEIKKAYADIINFQILKVDLPSQYEDSIVQTQVEVQKSNMRRFEQSAELTRQGIGVLESEARQTIKVINATAYAEAFKIEQFALVIYYSDNPNRLKQLIIQSMWNQMYIKPSKPKPDLAAMN